MSNQINESFVNNLAKMLNVPVSEVIQKLGYVEMVGNPFWKAEDDRRSASPEPAAPAAPKGGDQRLSPEPKAPAAPAPTRMPTGGAPDRSTSNPMITEGDRELGGMGARAASGSAGVQGQRDGSWRGQTPETLIPERLADNQTVYEAGDGSGGGAPQGRRNVSNGGYLEGGAQGYVDRLPPRPQPQRPQPPVRGSVPEGLSPNPNDTRTDMGEVLPPNTLRDEDMRQEERDGRGVPPDTGPYNSPAAQREVMGPPGAPPSALNRITSAAAQYGRGRLAANDLRVNQKSYSAIFNNNDPEAMLKKLADITGVRQDEIVKKLGNANFSENPFFDKDPRY